MSYKKLLLRRMIESELFDMKCLALNKLSLIDVLFKLQSVISGFFQLVTLVLFRFVQCHIRQLD